MWKNLFWCELCQELRSLKGSIGRLNCGVSEQAVLLSSAACEWRHLLQQRHSRLAQGLNHSHGNAWSWECADKHTHLIKTPRPERQLCSRADKVSDRKLRNTRGGCQLAVARYPFFLNDGSNNEIILFSCRKKKSGPLINEPVFTSVSLAEPESCSGFFWGHYFRSFRKFRCVFYVSSSFYAGPTRVNT